jgi:hypothetical protein
MAACGKRSYLTEELAIEALIGAHTHFDFNMGQTRSSGVLIVQEALKKEFAENQRAPVSPMPNGQPEAPFFARARAAPVVMPPAKRVVPGRAP